MCFRSFHCFDLSFRTTHHLVGVSPSKDDDYICTGVSVGDQAGDQTIYAVSFSALGQDGPGIKAHHMILSKCKKPKKTGFGETWDCQHHAMCDDQARRSTAKSFFLMIPSSRARSCSRGPSTRSRPNYQTMLVSPSSRTNTWSCRCSHQVPIPVDHRLPPHTRCTMRNLNKTTTVVLLCWFGRQSQSTLQVTLSQWKKNEGLSSFTNNKSRDVPPAPLPFKNSSFYPGRPWRCQLPSQLEASSSCRIMPLCFLDV